MQIPKEMKFTAEELHDLHKKIYLNGLIAWQEENADNILTAEKAENIFGNSCKAIMCIANSEWS